MLLLKTRKFVLQVMLLQDGKENNWDGRQREISTEDTSS